VEQLRKGSETRVLVRGLWPHKVRRAPQLLLEWVRLAAKESREPLVDSAFQVPSSKNFPRSIRQLCLAQREQTLRNPVLLERQAHRNRPGQLVDLPTMRREETPVWVDNQVGLEEPVALGVLEA